MVPKIPKQSKKYLPKKHQNPKNLVKNPDVFSIQYCKKKEDKKNAFPEFTELAGLQLI